MDKKESKKVDVRSSVRVVTSNNFVRAAGLEKISLKARKLLYIAMSQCKRTDKDFFQYSITAKEFASLMGIAVSHVYQDADQLTDELMQGFMKIESEKGKAFLKFKLFDKCVYSDGVLTFKMSSDMTPILLDLKKDFSKPLLMDFLKMKSSYSIEIWHLMQKSMHSAKPGIAEKIEFDLSLTELREVTGTQEKLKQIGQFKERVLDKALREIEERCGVRITYENIKSGKTVTGFHFTAVHLYHIDSSKIDSETYAKIDSFKRDEEARNFIRHGRNE